jgi:hypothetical protein
LNNTAANVCFVFVLDEASGGHGEKGIAALLDVSKGILFICVQMKLQLTCSCISLIYAYIVTVNWRKLVLFSEQLSSDSSIPLSPQWLYSKPVDAKPTANPAGVWDSCHFFNICIISFCLLLKKLISMPVWPLCCYSLSFWRL